MLSWLNRRGEQRPNAAADGAADAVEFRRKHELCRRIRRLAHKDRKRRSARLLERLVNDMDLAVMVRLEAARVLAGWDLRLLRPSAARLLASPDEVPSFQSELERLAFSREEKVPA